MGNCDCGHCDCEDEKAEEYTCDCKSTEEKLASLKSAIEDLGYKIEETEEGIKISE
jgi:hypothetical protein